MSTISIDATWIKHAKTGTAVYLLEILNAWNKDKRIAHKFLIFRPISSIPLFESLCLDHRFTFVTSPEDRRFRIFWQQIVIPKFLRDFHVDVHWGAGFVLPLISICPMVVTIHDLTFQKYPEFHEKIKRFYFPYMIRKAVDKAAAILTVSESTRLDLCDLYPKALGKSFVTTLAARSFSDFTENQSQTSLLFGLSKGSYFLFVGTLEPRKNLSRLLQAWHDFVSERKPPLKLVVVGMTGWMVEEVLDAFTDCAPDGVTYLDYVSDLELASLLKGALALVYPSLYEGFGLPVIEAMSLGVPVITSGIGATREIGEGAAELVDPLSVHSIKDALIRIATMPQLREALSRSGRARANSFSWNRAASDSLSALQSAINPKFSDVKYFNYLKRRSFFGLFYRTVLLYPRVERLLRGKALDVGCGIGDLLHHRPNTIGVDINPYNVDFCKKRGLISSVMQVDSLPYEKEIFDSVLLDNVLEHISDPTKLIEEIKRVLRPDGLLVLGVPGLKGQATDLDHKVYYSEAALETLAAKSGFKVNKYLYAPLFRSAFLSRTLTQYCIYTQWQKID